jgi:hypothetical protein
MALIDARWLNRFWTDEVPQGTIDGVNDEFTLDSLPVENDAVDVYLDGLKLESGVDYTVSGSTIEFVEPPALGQSLRVDYIKKSGA